MKRPYGSSSAASSVDDVMTEDDADLENPEEVLADQLTEAFSEVLADASTTGSEVLADVNTIDDGDPTTTTEQQAPLSDQMVDDKEENEEEGSRKICWGLLSGFGALGAVAGIGAVFGMMTGGPPIDEDDVIAAVALAKGGEAGGTAAAAGGAAQGATSAQTAVLQQMAVSAANNAASSVASGSQVLSNAAAGTAGAAGNTTAAASSGNTATTAAASATAVAAVAAAVAAGVVVSQKSSDGVPPICPNTTDPNLYLGSLSLDFLGNKSFLTLSEATNLTTKFLEEYNNVFGCESDYSRLSLNCSIPCFDVFSDDNSTTELQCCGPLDVPFFGDIMRCDMQCTVHCDGCFPNEPMFWVNKTDESSLDRALAQAATSTSTSDSSKRNLDENSGISPDEDVVCSPECEIGNAVGLWFCEEISPDDPDCSILIITTYDAVTDETANALEFVDRPTAAPSFAPSVVPSLAPSAAPSIPPTPAPSAAPTPLGLPLEYFLIQVLPEYKVLRQFFSGDVISLARDGVYLSIEAVPRKRDNVGSIVFTLVSRDGVVFPPRNDPPFTVGGTKVLAGADGEIEYLPVFQLAWTGQKELFVTTYSEDWGAGNELFTEVLSFEVVE